MFVGINKFNEHFFSLSSTFLVLEFFFNSILSLTFDILKLSSVDGYKITILTNFRINITINIRIRKININLDNLYLLL